MPGVLAQATPVREVRAWRNIALYGPPKVGKSTFCAGAPTPLFFDCDPGGGTISLLNHREFRDIPVINCRDGGGKKILGILNNLRRDMEGIETLILDTTSELVALELQRLRLSNKGKPGREEFKSTQPDYGEVNSMVYDIIVAMVDLPCNAVFIAHQREEKDVSNGTEAIITRPALPPALSSNLGGAVDLTCYMQSIPDMQDKEKRTLRVRPKARTQAGSRLFFPVAEIKDPKFNDLLTRFLPPDMVESQPQEKANASING